MKPKTAILLSLLILICLIGLSQESILLNAKIIDENQQPVANAHIVLKNHMVGTISDKAGIFDLHLLKTQMNDTLVISHITFTELSIPISDILIEADGHVFIMKRKNHLLDEVSIKHLKPVAIYGKAMEQLTENYHQQAAVLEVYYFNSEMRFWAETAKTEWRNGEATVLVLDEAWAKQENFMPSDNEKVRLVENTFRTSPDKPVKKWWKTNYLQKLMGYNVYKHDQNYCLPYSELKKLHLIYNDSICPSDSFYVLDFVTTGKPVSRYFIKKEDYKIMRIEEYRTPETTSKCNDTMSLFNRHSYLLAYDTTIINFQEIDNEVYLKDIRNSMYGMFRDTRNDTLVSANHYVYKMTITKIRPGESQLPNEGKESRISKSFYQNDQNEKGYDETEKYKHFTPKVMLPDSLEDFMESVRVKL
ncbi:MAG: carboxypeptidase-like regulatory domain-containing protein [Bacteroidales bacterium]|nr:carboxypeptidase-like regulatory domain-containing protein [Bacteroidales bacterium]MCF8458071.1 carboxypeptidase-like regulatory domain-containing protein [Bacteroidales bacterium]